MGKDLSEMSLEELWELFPIFLVAHDDRWKDDFNEIGKTLTGLLSDQPIVRISHIGSTAIQGIWAKNIVDVMVEIPQSADMKDMAQILEQNGFTIMSSEANRISLNKGYTENGFADKVYHIHLRYAGDNDELYEPAEPMFNIYHISPHETQNSDEFVTEICYPVKKK